MSELDNVTRLKDLNHLSEQAAGAIGKINSVPTVASGDENKFLRGDGTWAVPTFTLGTVSSTLEGAMWLED